MKILNKNRQIFSTRNLSLIVFMTSISLASNYAMFWILNVKLMDLFVFISGYMIGLIPGMIVGVLIWLVYGTLNPYGFNVIILAATCTCETFYAIAGWLSSKLNLYSDINFLEEPLEKEAWLINLKFGVIGFFATFFYDLLTNIVSTVIVGLSPIMAIISGAPFSIAHEVSNFFFFFFGCSPLIRAVKRFALIGR